MEYHVSFVRVSTALFSLFVIVLLGSWFRKQKIVQKESDATLHWLLIHLFTPCLIIDSFLANSGIEGIGTLFTAPLLGFSTILIGILVSTVSARLLGIPRGDQHKAFVVCTSFYNYGYLPVPLVMIFFDAHVLQMLFLFNVGLDIALWSIGFVTLTGKGSFPHCIKRAFNTPFLAILFSLAILAIYGGNPFPLTVTRIVHMTGQAAIPIALLILGTMAFDYFPVLRSPDQIREVFLAVVLRLLLIPLCFVFLIVVLPLPESVQIVLSVQAGMPSAVLPLVIISRYGGDISLALRIIVATSLGSLVTLPIWLSLLFSWVFK